MDRWLVLWNDGNQLVGAYVAAAHGRMPFGAEAALQALLQGEDEDFRLDAIVGPLPEGWDGNVVVDDEEAAVREMILP